MLLTDRDSEILAALCTQIRMITPRQTAHGWWPRREKDAVNAQARLRVLHSAQYLVKATVLARPLPILRGPVVRWSPGEFLPDFGAVAWKLQERWRVAARQTTVYLAAPRSRRLFGGNQRGVIRRQFQAGHDLGVTQMYVCIRRYNPQLLPCWIGEDRLAPARRQQKLPDAVLSASPDTLPYLVLEFGGAYDKARVQDFHTDCEARGLSYEIW